MTSRYAKSPISEAIIDLQVTFPADFSIEQFTDIHARVSKRYPMRVAMQKGSLMVQVGPQLSMQTNTSQEQYGYRFESADGLDIFQARIDGFTLNRLAPYRSWDELRDRAREIWEVYKTTAAPLAITRAAVRYINRIDIPSAQVNLNDYLLTVPEVGSGLSQGLSGFFMQLNCPQPDIDSTLLINEALLPRSTPGMTSVLLDFDLFRNHTWPIEDEEAVWSFLEVLRERRTRAFEASITDAARELFS